MKKLLTAIAKPFKFIKMVIWRAKIQDRVAAGDASAESKTYNNEK